MIERGGSGALVQSPTDNHRVREWGLIILNNRRKQNILSNLFVGAS